MNLFTLKKRTIIVVAIASAVIIGFVVWAITPYFTNITIDEPLPTSLELPAAVEKERITRVSTNVVDTQYRVSI